VLHSVKVDLSFISIDEIWMEQDPMRHYPLTRESLKKRKEARKTIIYVVLSRAGVWFCSSWQRVQCFSDAFLCVLFPEGELIALSE